MRLILKLPLHRSRAFTLIELIMTIVVIGVVALPISVSLSQHIQSVFQSQDITIATNLARFDLELMNNTAYASIIAATSTDYQGSGYYLDRKVSTVNSLVNGESSKKVTVWVRKSASTPVLAKLVTYISNNIRYPY